MAVIALLPIGMGSLVTTLGAGMAFLDWPSSDGQNMLLYPWLSDFRTNPDKFVEHGHRLAGMLIGVMSVVLVAVTWRKTRDRRIRWGAAGLLVAVILQGLLGGARVLLDRQVLAMTHSITAALFFCFTCVFAAACHARWREQLQQREGALSAVAAGTIVLLPAVVLVQYVLGGAFRHLNTMLHEHIAGAVFTAVVAIGAAWWLLRSGNRSLRRCGGWVLAALGLQVALGLSAYVTRLGLPWVGYVATAGSLSESIFCSAHTIGGMLLLNAAAFSTVTAVRLLRHNAVRLIESDAAVVAVTGRKGAGS